jgi:hypothetical protein
MGRNPTEAKSDENSKEETNLKLRKNYSFHCLARGRGYEIKNNQKYASQLVSLRTTMTLKYQYTVSSH